eukprot:CAMPEP_0167832544 /NCGR_PEP_ID=MMETSP0112_2-20121227/14421_1 /TAXON_ID=91324 /ORGANISM="Lotharella globosa, Strain CCCM811" /LENGTH=104 /DNA_ID=CAMNT_0007737655 /DNA_START=196 /DNA_END=510 /DNA_ORIENTATION=-
MVRLLWRLTEGHEEGGRYQLRRTCHDDGEVFLQISWEALDFADHEKHSRPDHRQTEEGVNQHAPFFVVLRVGEEHDPYHRRVYSPQDMPEVMAEGDAVTSDLAP